MSPIHKLLKKIYAINNGMIRDIHFRDGRLDLTEMRLIQSFSLTSDAFKTYERKEFKLERMLKSPQSLRLIYLIDQLDEDCRLRVYVRDRKPSRVLLYPKLT